METEMPRDIFVRIKEKLEESPVKETIKVFLKEIIMWEVNNAEKEHPRYREAYEDIIKKYLATDRAKEE